MKKKKTLFQTGRVLIKYITTYSQFQSGFSLASNIESFELDLTVLKQLNELFVCVEVLRPSQPNGVMSSAVSLPNHTFTGQA